MGLVLLVLALLAPLTVRAEEPEAPKAAPTGIEVQEAVAVSVTNNFIRIDVDDDGQFVIGTTGGDPTNPADDNKRLLFGFEPNGASDIWSSFTTVRVVIGTDAVDYSLRDRTPSSGPTAAGGSITTVWTLPAGVVVTQILSPMVNPFSGRADMVRIAYQALNTSNLPRSVGIRTLLDVMVGDNDAAPYFVPGVGNSNKEQQFALASMPASYTSFELNNYAANSLKGQGLLTRGEGITPPDRFVIASWSRSYNTLWDYTVTPANNTNDSATLMYWNPIALEPGQFRDVSTGYGLAGAGGGSIFSDTPVLVPVNDTRFDIVIWINNTTQQPFTNGTVVLTLPAGLTLVTTPSEAGEVEAASLTRSVGTVQAGTVSQVRWTVDATGGRGAYTYSAQATFQSGTPPLNFQQEIRVTDVSRLYAPAILR
jgi:hypothetical protein